MMEGAWPKLHREIHTKKHGSNRVSHYTMSTFHGAILVRRIGISGANVIAKSSEQAMDFGVVIQFTTLVKEDTLS